MRWRQLGGAAADRFSRGARQRCPIFFRRHTGAAKRGATGPHAEHDREFGAGDHIGPRAGITKRHFDIEQGRVRVGREHLGDSGSDGGNIESYRFEAGACLRPPFICSSSPPLEDVEGMFPTDVNRCWDATVGYQLPEYPGGW